MAAWGTLTQESVSQKFKAAGTSAFSGVSVTQPAEVLLFASGACDNSGSNLPTVTLNKPAGETRSWRVVYHGSVNATAAASTIGWIAYLRTSVAWSAHSLTATYSNSITAKVGSLFSITGGLTGDNVALSANGAWTYVGTSFSFSNLNPISDDDLIVGMTSQEDNSVPTQLRSDVDPLTVAYSDNTTGGSAVTNVGMLFGWLVAPAGGPSIRSNTASGETGADGGGVMMAFPGDPSAPSATARTSNIFTSNVVVQRSGSR